MRRAAISRFRRFACGVAVVSILSPAVLAPPSGLVVAVPAALAVAVAILPWPIGRVSLAQAAGALGALSLVVDLAYFGPRELALLHDYLTTARRARGAVIAVCRSCPNMA